MTDATTIQPVVDDDVHPLVARAFAAFDEAGVPWCVLRREDELVTPSGDIDVLVDARSAPRARRALEHCGLVCIPASAPGSHVFFMAYDGRSDCWLAIDVVTRLAFGRLFSLETDAAGACLSSRRRVRSVSVLAPPDAFWALFLHCLLDKRTFPWDDRRRLETMSRRLHDDPGALLHAIFRLSVGFEWRAVLDAVQRGDWTAAMSAAESLERTWRRARPGAVGGALLMNFARRALDAWVVVRRRRGLVAAFLGIDGAGKTTLVTELRERLPFPVRVIYGGMWRAEGRSGPAATVARLLRPALRPVGIWSRYVRALRHRALGRLVLFDRYTYDAYLPPEKPFVRLKRAYFWFLAHSCPAPDVVVLLDVSADAAASRKPDEPAPPRETHRLRLLDLQNRLPRVAVLDAARPPAVVRRDVTELLWQRYRRGWTS